MLSAGKKLIGVLEKDLEIVRHINHPNVVSLYEFKIVHTETDGWRIYLLTEYSPSCYTSLSDLLDTVETVSVKVAKNWTSNILMVWNVYTSTELHTSMSTWKTSILFATTQREILLSNLIVFASVTF